MFVFFCALLGRRSPSAIRLQYQIHETLTVKDQILRNDVRLTHKHPYFYFLLASGLSCGAVDGCHTPVLTPFGEHKEDYTNKNATSSLLLLAITDTRRIRYFVGGFPGSCGDSTSLKRRSWFMFKAMLRPEGVLRPLSVGEFILGDAGFGLTPFIVRNICTSSFSKRGGWEGHQHS